MSFKQLSRFNKALVTGGAGFIGGNLIQKLLLDTDINVLNIDKLNYASDLKGINMVLDKLENNVAERYNMVELNICDKDRLMKVINDYQPDIVFHLAAESHVDRSIDSPSSFINSNILGTFNVLESLRKYMENTSITKKKLFRLLHISTDEVFGSLGKNGIFNESSRYKPTSPYSASKASSDHLVRAWNQTYDIPAIITNCSNNFGPWQFPEKLIPLTILKAIHHEDIPIYGNGQNIRDWLYVEDHVNALLIVADKGINGNNYCIGGANEISNLEIVELICNYLDLKFNTKESHRRFIKYVEDRPAHDFRYAIDSSLIKKELGWKNKFDFKDALEKTIQWYLNNLDWCEFVKKKGLYDGGRLGI